MHSDEFYLLITLLSTASLNTWEVACLDASKCKGTCAYDVSQRSMRSHPLFSACRKQK